MTEAETSTVTDARIFEHPSEVNPADRPYLFGEAIRYAIRMAGGSMEEALKQAQLEFTDSNRAL